MVVLPEPVGPVTRMMPCGLRNRSAMFASVFGIHAERRQVQPPGLLVEDTQHHAFAVARGNGRDAHVDRASGDPQADASVLRQALLGDVELGHDLDARDDQRRDRAPALQHFAQHAVDAEAHHQAVLERLDVDVGGVFLHRLREHGVDEPDDGRVVFALEQVRLFGQVLREVREVGGFLDTFGGLHGVVAGFVGLAQQRVERVVFDLLEPQRNAEIAAHFGDRERRDAGPVDALGDAFVHAARRARRGAWRTRTRRAADGPARSAATSFMASEWRLPASSPVRRHGQHCPEPRGTAAEPRAAAASEAAAARGSLLNGSSGRISPLERPAARCSSRM